MPSKFVQQCLDLFDAATRDEPQVEQASERRQLCELVATGLEQGRHSAIEHPEGLNNGLSYMIPAMLHQNPVVIATTSADTIQAYITVANSLAKIPVGSWPESKSNPEGEVVHALLPRDDYLCRLLVESNRPTIKQAIPQQRRADFLGWATTTKTGARHTTPFKVSNALWNKVSVSDRDCQHVGCHFWKTCYTEHAREVASSASVILTTHSYYSSEKTRELQTSDALPSHGRVIFDCAHTLAEQLKKKHLARGSRPSLTGPKPEPTDEPQRHLDLLLGHAQTDLMSLVGKEEFAAYDPLALHRLNHKPDLEDWIRHAKERLRLFLVRHLLSETQRGDNVPVPRLSARQEGQLATLLDLTSRLRGPGSWHRMASLPRRISDASELSQYFGHAIDAESEQVAQEITQTHDSLASDLEASWGSELYELLDPMRNSPVARWNRGHFWLQHARAALRRNKLDIHASYFAVDPNDETTDIRNKCLSSLEYKLLVYRLGLAEEISRNSSRSIIGWHTLPKLEATPGADNTERSVSARASHVMDVELEIQSVLLRLQEALEESKRPIMPRLLGAFGVKDDTRHNYFGIFGIHDAWLKWSTSLSTARLLTLQRLPEVSRLRGTGFNRDELVASGRTILSLLDVMQLSVEQLSAPENASTDAVTHYATISLTETQPRIAYVEIDRWDERQLGHRLRREFRRNVGDFSDPMFTAPTRPVFVSSRLSREMTTVLGAYDNALPNRVKQVSSLDGQQRAGTTPEPG